LGLRVARLELADQRLGRVGDVDDGGEADGGGASFHRVHAPEDRVPERPARRLLLDAHELGGELLELFRGLRDEGVQELVGSLGHEGTYSPSTFFTTARTSSPRNGLTMKSVAPASMASITSDSCPSAEHMITTALGSSWTISRVASMPDL